MDLTDKQWDALFPLFPPAEMAPLGVGRWKTMARASGDSEWRALDLRAGAPWKDLPKKYPPYQTCHRRGINWGKDDLLARMLRILAEDPRKRGKVDLTEAYIDGTHSDAKKGCAVSCTRGGKTTKIMAVVDRNGLPIAAGIAGGAIHDTRLVKEVLEARFTVNLPKNLIGDKAYDSDSLDLLL